MSMEHGHGIEDHETMKARTLLLIIAIPVAVAAVVGYRMYEARPAEAADRAVEISVDATTLYAEFTQDETAAGERYNDKVVAVQGVIRDIVHRDEGTTDVLLETGDPLGAVVCAFAAGEAAPTEKNSTVRIKGFCAGYNLDVLLQRCSITDRIPDKH